METSDRGCESIVGKFVTLQDIAVAAHSNKCAVSRTLNNHPLAARIRRETREQILAAAERLGYRPRQRYGSDTAPTTIALVVDLIDYPRSEVLNRITIGILTEASAHGALVQMYPWADTVNALDNILRHHISKLVVLSYDQRLRLLCARFCRDNGLEAVFGQEESCLGFPAVNTDNRAAGAMAAEWLHAEGHVRVGLVGGDPRLYLYARDRYEGFMSAAKRLGMVVDKRFIVLSDHTEQLSLKWADSPLRRQLPTAFFAFGDHEALLLQTILANHSVRVPEEVTIISCGDLLLGRVLTPPLKSLNMRFEDTGRCAVRILLHASTPGAKVKDGVYLLAPRLPGGTARGK